MDWKAFASNLTDKAVRFWERKTQKIEAKREAYERQYEKEMRYAKEKSDSELERQFETGTQKC